MSRPERVDKLLVQIQEETANAFDEHAELLDKYTFLKRENVKLEELLLDLYCLCFPQNFEWEVADHTWEKYLPCKLCKEAHGGKAPCASTSEDLEEECCKPFQAVVIANCMRALGIEVDCGD